jgi:hypothetical protein
MVGVASLGYGKLVSYTSSSYAIKPIEDGAKQWHKYFLPISPTLPTYTAVAHFEIPIFHPIAT